MIVEDRTEEAQVSRVLHDQAVALIAMAVLEMGFCALHLREQANETHSLVALREAKRSLARLDGLLREADDADPAYVRSSPYVLALRKEKNLLSDQVRGGL